MTCFHRTSLRNTPVDNDQSHGTDGAKHVGITIATVPQTTQPPTPPLRTPPVPLPTTSSSDVTKRGSSTTLTARAETRGQFAQSVTLPLSLSPLRQLMFQCLPPIAQRPVELHVMPKVDSFYKARACKHNGEPEAVYN